MPKKKIFHHDEPLPTRPQRNMKAKVVFDPSDNHIPKKRAKYSYKNEKPIETSTIKKTTNDRTRVRKKKQITTRSKILPVIELLDDLSTEINTKSPIVSPKNSPVKSVTIKDTQEKLRHCFICETISGKTELINCSICLTKAHRDCLIINEPLWKFKLDLCPWICKQCRKQNCSKCLKDDSRSILRRCVTCEVGLHSICYELCEIKPLHKLETDMYLCIPCMTLATQINPEEVNEAAETIEAVKTVEAIEAVNADIEDDIESYTSSIMSISSDEYDTDSNSNISYSCSSDYEKYNAYKNYNIPSIIKWNKDQVFEYLAEVLPQEIIDQIIKYVLYYEVFYNSRISMDVLYNYFNGMILYWTWV
ncbi:hypothetical protein QTP88_026592 [Uroleucon formosanum]